MCSTDILSPENILISIYFNSYHIYHIIQRTSIAKGNIIVTFIERKYYFSTFNRILYCLGIHESKQTLHLNIKFILILVINIYLFPIAMSRPHSNVAKAHKYRNRNEGHCRKIEVPSRLKILVCFNVCLKLINYFFLLSLLKIFLLSFTLL